jgi:uncharacterized coiled-coil protein SlyX
MVVSRAEELCRYDLVLEDPHAGGLDDSDDGPYCYADQALAIIHYLESALAQRDDRIAELSDALTNAQGRLCERNRRIEGLERAQEVAEFLRTEQTRAEVPEWCQRFVRKVYYSVRVGEYGGFRIDKSGIAGACHVLTETRLRACGIEVP